MGGGQHTPLRSSHLRHISPLPFFRSWRRVSPWTSLFATSLTNPRKSVPTELWLYGDSRRGYGFFFRATKLGEKCWRCWRRRSRTVRYFLSNEQPKRIHYSLVRDMLSVGTPCGRSLRRLNQLTMTNKNALVYTLCLYSLQK